MRTVPRRRRYVARHWLVLGAPLLTYNQGREAFILRAVGRQVGPVLRLDRRVSPRADGMERHDARVA